MLVQISSLQFPELVLTAMGDQDHSIITLSPNRRLPNQIFRMTKEVGDWYSFKLSQRLDRCIDYDKSNHNLQVYRRHIINDDNQKWRLIQQGMHRIIESKARVNMVMTCAERNVGTPMRVEKNVGGRVQMFTIRQVM